MKNFTLLIGLITILHVTGFPQPCLPDGIGFESQEDIDNFPIDYPNCTEIEGGVGIIGEDITNLNGLSAIMQIGGSLNINYNPNLANFSGLDNLITIGEHLYIYQNNGLLDLSGLENLTTIGEYLVIDGNDELTSLAGLENLVTVGGHVRIVDNSNLKSLESLNNLTLVGGYIRINYNDSLSNLNGLNNIDASTIEKLSIMSNYSLSNCNAESICSYLVNPTGEVTIKDNASGCNNPPEIAESCGITLPCLPYGEYYFSTQSEIDNFQYDYPGCTELEGNVKIKGDNITNLEGLNVLTSINCDFTILVNNALTSLNGLNNVSSISGNLQISSNHALTNLSGLESLDSIGGKLHIWSNSSLSSLTALENLSSIGESLIINGNILLSDLNGLENISQIGGPLLIINNTTLSECNVQSICNFIAGANASINNNAPGCNSPEEVEEACNEMEVSENLIISNFSFYPNPASSMIFIKNENKFPIEEINIYNQLGQKLLNIKQPEKYIDIEKLQQGIYFIEITSEELKIKQKLIIK